MTLVQRGHRVFRVLRVTKASQGLRVKLALPAHKGPREMPVHLELKVRRATLVPKDKKVIKVKRVKLVQMQQSM